MGSEGWRYSKMFYLYTYSYTYTAVDSRAEARIIPNTEEQEAVQPLLFRCATVGRCRTWKHIRAANKC